MQKNIVTCMQENQEAKQEAKIAVKACGVGAALALAGVVAGMATGHSWIACGCAFAFGGLLTSALIDAGRLKNPFAFREEVKVRYR